MNHYIDTNNNIWGFDDTQNNLIPAGAVLIPTTYIPDQYPHLTLVKGKIEFNSATYIAAIQAAKLTACKSQAQQLLQATDWDTLPDVTTSSPRLANQADFLAYRSTIRALVVRPVVNPAWPTVPTGVWV